MGRYMKLSKKSDEGKTYNEDDVLEKAGIEIIEQ